MSAKPFKRKFGFAFGAKKPAVDDLSCPCCFRPGEYLCGTCVPIDTAQRLTALRQLMKVHSIDCYFVPSEDAHSSEYVSITDERRAYLTGFTGSAGTALVTHTEALCWTDSRYFLQATEQLATPWVLMQQYEPGVPHLEDWIATNLAGKTVSCDPAVLPAARLNQWNSDKWEPAKSNLVDLVWGNDRPPRPCNPIYIHPLQLAGVSVADKLQAVRAEMASQQAGALVVNALDQVAWITNLRGSDIECNPIFFAYMVIQTSAATLYLQQLDSPESHSEQISIIEGQLEGTGIQLQPYGQFVVHLPSLLGPVAADGLKVMIEETSCTVAIADLIPDKAALAVSMSPIETLKACKNSAEIEGLRAASVKDSLAICQQFAWLEQLIKQGDKLTEFEAATKLHGRRMAQDGCVGDSFPTISSTGANAAIVHHHCDESTAAVIAADNVYLCDTGGQYKEGTTDITRTLHFGIPTNEQKDCFTAVLQGHIALAAAVFPEGCPGLMLEMLARGPLWQQGLNYGHGTGHGIGAHLNVHEGPMGIGGGSVPGSAILANPRMQRAYLCGFESGMVLSNEPGFYKAGEFGIRIESDLVVVPADTTYNFGSRAWLRFENLTQVPISKKLMQLDMMSKKETEWLNTYHESIWKCLSPLLGDNDDDNLTREWLRKATTPIGS